MVCRMRSGLARSSITEPVVPLRSGNSMLWPSALMKLHSPVARITSTRLRRNAGAVAVAERFEPAVPMHDALGLAGGAGGEDDERGCVAARVERCGEEVVAAPTAFLRALSVRCA